MSDRLGEALLRTEGLDVERGGHRVLRDVSIQVDHGEALAILGRNGAGKTTLVESIAGLLRIAKGSVTVEGRPTSGMSPQAIARQGVALVPEGRRLFWNMSVIENLALGAHTSNWWWGGPAVDAYDLVWQLFPALRDMRNRKANTLSGGQQQMLAIARALMSRPKLLILDEPSTGLSPQAVETICEHLIGLRERGFSMLLVEQSADVALDVCSRAALLAEGRIVAEDASGAISQSPMFLEALFGTTEAPGLGVRH